MDKHVPPRTDLDKQTNNIIQKLNLVAENPVLCVISHFSQKGRISFLTLSVRGLYQLSKDTQDLPHLLQLLTRLHVRLPQFFNKWKIEVFWFIV